MKPVEDFYYGLGIIVAVIIMLVTWALVVAVFDASLNIGSYSGVIAMGLFYMYRGIKNGANP